MIPAFEKGSTIRFEPWYNYLGRKFASDLPEYFDDTNWKWVKEGEEHFSVFKKEIDAVLKKSGILEPYFHRSLVSGGKWEIVNFFFWNKKHGKNCAECPALTRWLESIPGMVTAGISYLSPHTEIKPHVGDTNMIARCHMGLYIPAGLPECGIKVNDKDREWKEGKFLLFCDAYMHSAWNRTDKNRYVLIIDVVLPRFIGEKENISKNVRANMKMLEAMEKHPWRRKLPRFISNIIRNRYKRMV
ncbi:MAG TPA: aspartyl/asparaginyl beta-hydroxylase domain-containing protein [Bacteroidia bacterium]|jgi:aspartyl/asparaginyl beta-hydroxylase (cupin superfamily)|nr:aspartyl/asparaginyl beta-hydroxylase domain-containing protein [Bacteroidia bacterium]